MSCSKVCLRDNLSVPCCGTHYRGVFLIFLCAVVGNLFYMLDAAVGVDIHPAIYSMHIRWCPYVSEKLKNCFIFVLSVTFIK